jgi:hypothetical protein
MTFHGVKEGSFMFSRNRHHDSGKGFTPQAAPHISSARSVNVNPSPNTAANAHLCNSHCETTFAAIVRCADPAVSNSGRKRSVRVQILFGVWKTGDFAANAIRNTLFFEHVSEF